MRELVARARENLARFAVREKPVSGLRQAAVVLTLLPDSDGTPCFLVTRRAARLNRHAGQFAFPGGRVDPGETHQEAALRELHEEVGLVVPPQHVLGRLDDYVTRSGYRITPFVAHAPDADALAPNPVEVEKAHVIPLAALEHPDVPRLRSIPESNRPILSVPLYEVIGTEIHAPTAALLYQLREVVVHGRDTRVDHFDAPVFAWQ